MVRHCHSAIGWLGSLWFFPRTFSSRCYSPSEGFSPPGYFSWKLSPFGVITLGFSEIFSFRCLFSSSRFSSFFTFMLGSTRAVLAIIFQWFGFFFSDLIFSDASTWSSYLHARGSIRAVLPFFSSTFDPSFRMFRRRILGFYLECFGHRFHNCMAIHFSDARLWFIFLLTFSSASISLVVGVSFSFVFVQIIWDTQSTIAWISFPIFGVWAFSNGCRWLLIISQPSCG